MANWREYTEAAFAKLPTEPDWDSYGGLPIDRKMIYSARFVLSQIMADDTPAPSVVPMSNGSVQFEWDIGGWGIEVEMCELITPYGGVARYCQVLYDENFGAEDGLAEQSMSLDNLGPLRDKLAELTKRHAAKGTDDGSD